jgi:nitrate reductase beta subunit
MAMMRSYMRAQSTGQSFDESRLERIGMTPRQTEQMYRLLAIAKYEDRFVIPTSHKEGYSNPYRAQGSAGYGDTMGNMGSGSGCDGCSMASSMGMEEPLKTGKEMYEENFYGGIWRD